MHRAFAFGLGALALAACTSDVSEGDSEFRVEGVVVDELSGEHVGGAKVSFVSDTLDKDETTADSAGEFTLDVVVPDGVVFGQLHAERAGYVRSPDVTVYFDETSHRIELLMRAKAP